MKRSNFLAYGAGQKKTTDGDSEDIIEFSFPLTCQISIVP
jgi:hypothetical protein